MVIGWAAVAGYAQAFVTNPRTGASYTTLTDAVNAAAAGDTLRLDAGAFAEAGTVLVGRDLVLEGAGTLLTTVTLASGVDPVVVQLSPGVSLTVRDLAVEGVGADQGAIWGPDGGNALMAERVSFVGASPAQGLVILDGGAASVAITDASFVGAPTGLSGVGLGVVGAGTTPVDLVGVTFRDLSVSDLASGLIGLGVDATCDGCLFERSGTSDELSVEAIDSTLTVLRSRFCDSGAVYVDGTPATVTNATFARSGGVIAIGSAVDLRYDTLIDAPTAAVTGLDALATFTIRDVLFHQATTPVPALSLAAPATPTVEYSWLQGTAGVVNLVGALSATNRVNGGAPLLVGEPLGDCVAAPLWPTPIASPVLDAGDPAVLDLDGSRSDIGAFGGPGAPADPVGQDADADGFFFLHDCDDADAATNPGAVEVCDGHDDDCDGLVDDADPGLDPTSRLAWFADCDGDGQGAGASVLACDAPAPAPCAWTTAGTDCDDADPLAFVGADEQCLPGDQDCDGDPDAGAIDAVEVWVDQDGDGYGVDGTEGPGCVGPGSTTRGGDCADADAALHPDQPDACGDGVDTDCDGGDGDLTNEVAWYPDADGDGFGDAAAAPRLDCDLSPAYTTADLALDCDDAHAEANPDGTEICDGLDDDCDGQVDEEPVERWYADDDGDGHGAGPAVELACPGAGWSLAGDDCDDRDPTVYAGAIEACDGVDDDCDGLVDEDGDVRVWYRDQDGDGHGDRASGEGTPCQPGDDWVLVGDDCDDTDPAVVTDCADPKAEAPAASSGCGCDGAGGAGALGWLVAAAGFRFARRRTNAAPESANPR